ncbi:BT_3928 family protein [Gaetbulibacter jejuensis]|uniref:BT_3928 family protein n=1 Tax=Gaetbulibacter jejuensis TaxID=584607 RepID=UPI00300BB78E
MKFIVNVSRLLVGALFIFSGFIKLNDPLGFSYKLQEYFSYDVLNIPFLEPYALGISIFVVIFEVVLGIFLLIGYKPKFTVWSLLAMIVFFTFLTFYAAYFDKVKDCGCFGDFLKLTPWESFTKDVILLVLILILFFGVKHIKPIFGKLGLTVASLLSFIACLWFAYHVLMHLPVFDFRAYKIGSNIQDNMTIPEGAKKPVMEWIWLFDVNGEEKEFVTNGSYPTVEGKLISYETKVIEKGYEPSILDFSIESDDEDLTTQFLEEDHLVMITSYSLESAEVDGLKKLKAVSDKAIENGYTVIGLSASGNDVKAQIKKDYDLNFDFYLCDEKVLKTIVRSNPGVLVLEKGTVLQKEHWNDIEDIELPKVERKQEVIKDDGTVYLIDGEISTKEEVEALTKDDIEAMYVLKERNEGNVLDSINAANKTNYTSFVEAVLKKE